MTTSAKYAWASIALIFLASLLLIGSGIAMAFAAQHSWLAALSLALGFLSYVAAKLCERREKATR